MRIGYAALRSFVTSKAKVTVTFQKQSVSTEDLVAALDEVRAQLRDIESYEFYRILADGVAPLTSSRSPHADDQFERQSLLFVA